MITISEMTAEQLRECVRTVCSMLARRRYRAANPNATDDEVEQFAERNWRTFKADAIDFLAMAEADREARSAASTN